jgi:hypothetical protein
MKMVGEGLRGGKEGKGEKVGLRKRREIERRSGVSGKSSMRKREEKRKKRGEKRRGTRSWGEGEVGGGGGKRKKGERYYREKMGQKLFQYEESRGNCKEGKKGVEKELERKIGKTRIRRHG